MSDEEKLIGKVFAGRYRVEKLIGRGGMGRVYRATHLTMEKRVALKVLAPEVAEDPDNVDRFEREAAASAKLNHPNTIHIFDYGTSDDGQLYLAMEHLSGRNLAQCIADEGALSPATTVHIVTQTLKSLKEAHAHGIIHRDLKPENVFLANIMGEPDYVKVLDFGIAKFLDSERIKETLTKRGFVCGTPLYVAPEQAMGYPVSPATDIYSVGIMLYEMLAGRPPFEGDDPLTMVMMQVHQPPPPLPPPVAELVPDSLEDLIVRMLDKAPGRRPVSADEVLRHFATMGGLPDRKPEIERLDRDAPDTEDRCESGGEGDAEEPTRLSAPGAVDATLQIGLGEHAQPTVAVKPAQDRRVSRRRMYDLLTVALAIALVALGVFLWGYLDRPSGPATTSGSGVETEAVSSEDEARTDECVADCLKNGYVQKASAERRHIAHPSRLECERHCAR